MRGMKDLAFMLVFLFVAERICGAEVPDGLQRRRLLEFPKIIAHRGGSGVAPESSMTAYNMSLSVSEYLECDVQLTSDLQLICYHDPMLFTDTSNIQQGSPAAFTEAAQELVTTHCDTSCASTTEKGWFFYQHKAADYADVKLRQRYTERDQALNDKDGLVSFSSYVDFAVANNRGLYVESKTAAFYKSTLNVEISQKIVEALCAKGFCDINDVTAKVTPPVPVWIQTFDRQDLDIIQGMIGNQMNVTALVWDEGKEAKYGNMYNRLPQAAAGKPQVTLYDVALDDLKTAGATAIGYDKHQIIANNAIVADAHKAGLEVHVWTFVTEPVLNERGVAVRYIDTKFGQDAYDELEFFANLKVDGIFDDMPAAPANLKKFLEMEEKAEKGSAMLAGSVGTVAAVSCLVNWFFAVGN